MKLGLVMVLPEVAPKLPLTEPGSVARSMRPPSDCNWPSVQDWGNQWDVQYQSLGQLRKKFPEVWR